MINFFRQAVVKAYSVQEDRIRLEDTAHAYGLERVPVISDNIAYDEEVAKAAYADQYVNLTAAMKGMAHKVKNPVKMIAIKMLGEEIKEGEIARSAENEVTFDMLLDGTVPMGGYIKRENK